jgi:hypothetical protein
MRYHVDFFATGCPCFEGSWVCEEKVSALSVQGDATLQVVGTLWAGIWMLEETIGLKL